MEAVEAVVEVVEESAGYPWEAEYLTDSEWWDMAFEIVSRSFDYVFDNEFLRLFATLVLLSVVIGMMSWLFRGMRKL